MNIGANDIKCVSLEVSGSSTLSGALNITETSSSVISGNVASGVPLLICQGTNPANGNTQVGISCQNSSGNKVNLVSTNAPSPVQSIVADNNLLITSLAGTITLYPNTTPTIVASSTNTSIATPLSLPAQQFLELALLTPFQAILTATTSPIFFNSTVKNVGDLGYAASVITVNTTGTYIVSYSVTFPSNADNNSRTTQVAIGGSNYALQNVQNGNGSTTLSGSVPVYLTASTTFTISCAQASGGTLTLSAAHCNIARIA
jgi:hypothetical protein